MNYSQLTSIAWATRVCPRSHMVFKILLAAAWRSATLDFEATVNG